MSFELKILQNSDENEFKIDAQESFQKGFEDRFGKIEETVLPIEDIDNSLYKNGAVAYKAFLDGEYVGGVIVVIDEKTNYNHLDILFVKNGVQSKGVGKEIWDNIEKLYPNTIVWETCTPYFERRNIHFYVNKCGFIITEFYNEKHPDTNVSEDFIGDGNEGMFVLKKHVNHR